MSVAPLRIFYGQTAHKRYVPFEHKFKYGLAMIDINIDQLEQAGKMSALFSTCGPNLFSFSKKDHGDRSGGSLRTWAEARLAEADIDNPGGIIRLLTFPRHVFYKFAPISIWLIFDPDGIPRAVLYEVHNTFGESHTYAAEIPGHSVCRHLSDKRFHVSPFFDVSGKYQFTLNTSDEAIAVTVTSLSETGKSHSASMALAAKPATSLEFVRMALSKPFSTLGVTIAIHWQALKLWIKGAKYFKRPALPESTVTRAHKSSPKL